MAGFIRHVFAAALAFAALVGAPAYGQGASQAQELSNCAGAVAAEANLDVIAYPSGASGDWAPVLGRILEALNREEGVEGITGRYAASAAKSYWAERPAAERTAAANACRTRYAG